MSENWRTFLRMQGYFLRVLALVWRANPAYALATLGLTIVGAMAGPAQIWLVKVLIDRVSALLLPGVANSPLDWTPLVVPMAALLAVLIVGGLCLSLAEHLHSLLGFHTATYVDYLILQKAAQLDIAFYETPGFYDQLSRVRGETWRAHNLARLSINIVSYSLSTLSILALLARIHPLAVVVLLLVSAPNLFIKSHYAKQIFSLWNLRTPAQRMVNYLTDLLISPEAIKEVRLFGLQNPFLERFRLHWKVFLDEYGKIIFAQERLNILFSVISTIGAGGIWAFAIVQTALNRLSLGDLALAFQSVEQARRGMSDLFSQGGMFYEHSLYIGNLYSFLEMKSDSVEGALHHPVSEESIAEQKSDFLPLQQGIEFRNVSFRYPASSEFVLRDLSFSIPPGQSVAVVGENGAGKTTLVKLLARFYDPTEGDILVDGRDLREYKVSDLHKKIGVIFQDFVRYHLTAQENIGFGQLEHAEDRERVASAAQKGGAATLIDKLPSGYATLLGKTFEGGVDLSGGEWQKIALSRAFMRQSQILILDEPTAALDALAEFDVYTRFNELTSGKITLFISHRFSTVRMAQQILVLENGRLTEMGSHDELMVLGKQYARMYSAQAERYR